MISQEMQDLLVQVSEIDSKFDLALMVQTPDGKGNYISDNLHKTYLPARAENLVFRLLATFVEQLDFDYDDFIEVLRADLEDNKYNIDVNAMRKQKLPPQKLTMVELEEAERQVENLVNSVEKLAKDSVIGDYVIVVNYTNRIGDVFFHDTSDEHMSTYRNIQVMLMDYANRGILNGKKVLQDFAQKKSAPAQLLNKKAFEDRAVDGFKPENFWQLYRAPYQGGQFNLITPESLRVEHKLIEDSKTLQKLDFSYSILFVKTDKYVYVATPAFRTEDDLIDALVSYLTVLEHKLDFSDEEFKTVSDLMLDEKYYVGLVHGGAKAYAVDLPIKKEIEDSEKIQQAINKIAKSLSTYQKLGSIHEFYLFANIDDDNFASGSVAETSLTSYLLTFQEMLAYLTHMYPNIPPKKLIDLAKTKEDLKRK